ncbi:UDP-N-acetylenolpyruvoylglucosamine reductase [Corynebacterium aquatimens]|nr:UDP-N-acetylenolpyruvoylglucosamine reductase [Corynebacterium aquatimens]
MVYVSDSPATQNFCDIPDCEALDGVRFADLTTLRIGGTPRRAYRARSSEALALITQLLDDAGHPLLIVGGGSNLVVADGELDLTAVIAANDDIHVNPDGLVRAGAGAVWDDVVAQTVAAGLRGIETLSGIPGSAGATPVQNVGAYGTEVSDVLARVHLYNRKTKTTEWVPAADLDLAYRYSNLKFTGRAVVLDIELQLEAVGPSGDSIPLRHRKGEKLPLAKAREEIISIRAQKGMVLDPTDHDTWSAGSFFTNPIVPQAHADAIQQQRAAQDPVDAESMPRFLQPDGTVKLSAAWLIERAGFPKGFPNTEASTEANTEAPARLSTKHTLALTNRGSATADDIVALARTIRAGVQDAFSVTLEAEPVWVGLTIGE